MTRFSKLPNLLVSSMIASLIVPQVALGQNPRCSNFWVNPNTGEQECLNHSTASTISNQINPNSNQTNSSQTDNNFTGKSNLLSLKLEEESDIKDAVKLSNKLMQVVLQISNCQKSSNESLESCKCQAKSEIESIKNLFQTTIEEHPNWENQEIKYPIQNSSPNVTGTGKINFPKLKKELEAGKYLGQPCE